MTGWRIGYLNAPEHVFKEASKVQGQSTSHPCSIAQKAALGALIGGDHDVENMRKAFSLRKHLVCDLLSTIPGIRFHIPDGAFYVFIELGSILVDAGIEDDALFCSYLLDRFLLALVPGSAFGNPNSIRISFAASEQTLQKGILRLAEGISSLQNQKNV
jgi:aspartate/methionine/tyrosine aminotransferase